MLKIENLRKDYGTFHLDCSMDVANGCVTGLIGQNGAGKTTVFKAILGLIHPQGGNIRVFGKDASDLTSKDRQRIGVVLSDSGFSGYLSIRDITPILANLYDRFDREYFCQQCRNYQLPENKKIKDFSTGMKAKLKMLAAISHGADLLILDEPTAGLDVVAREDLIDILRQFMEQDENHAILISSHISSDLEGLCDELYMIHNGKIILHEETDVLLDRYAVLKLDPAQYQKIDRQHILKTRRESWGYSCLTDQKPFYMEKYPSLTFENGTINELMVMMIKGEEK